MGKAVIRRKGVKYANPKTPGHANLRRLHVYMHMHMCMCTYGVRSKVSWVVGE